MISLKTRTEFSFRHSFGHLQKYVDACEGDSLGICDRNSTWGHAQFQNMMRKAGKKPIFGVELGVVVDASIREKQPPNFMSFIAANNDGLQEIYALVNKSTENFYYEPRIDWGDVRSVSENVFILSGITPDINQLIVHKKNLFIELCPGSCSLSQGKFFDEYLQWGQVVATSNNNYLKHSDHDAYQIAVGMHATKQTYPQHLLDEWDWREEMEGIDDSILDLALGNVQKIADKCNAELPSAEMVRFHSEETLEQLCRRLAKERGVDLNDKIYSERFEREMGLIDSKGFVDYFFVIWDMLVFAKQHMLVGPARGSSCGSLVCYILSITEIDPIPYGLIFERFIDINRADMPDIDIDFPDNKRDMVFEYCREKYGADCVARLGTVARFKAKSTIVHVAKQLQIAPWELNELKEAIIDRKAGDARANNCIEDTFKEVEIGKKAIKKFPELQIAGELEGHATHTGQHAAGIVITDKPVNIYCSVDQQNGATQIDKIDAEELNLLKIDALGLRTLSVIQDCLDQIGWSREELMAYPTDDPDAFQVLQNKRYAGIFQFEGYALQSLCNKMTVDNFEDIAALTALARPGPLMSGGAADYVARRNGEKPVEYAHPIIEELTGMTYGIITYQEQVMHIARQIGLMDWADVSFLRKAMSKSLGKEFFDKYWDKFRDGAIENGMTQDSAKTIWDNINTMGAWAFNRSHAVAYGMVSYWTCVLKSKFPLEYAAACLRHAKDDDQCIKLLRELVVEGYKYKDFHRQKSQVNWSVQDGVLYGGLVNVKGIGEKTAEAIIAAREAGEELTAGQQRKIDTAETPFKHAFKRESLFGSLIRNPEDYNISSKIYNIDEIPENANGNYLILAEIKKKTQRDHNEPKLLEKRGYKMRGNTVFVNLTVEDDTGQMMCMIPRNKYAKFGRMILEDVKNGTWLLIKGSMKGGYRSIMIDRLRVMNPEDFKE